MNTLLKNIFGRAETPASKPAPSTHSGPQSQQDTAETATWRQLAQTLLLQVMRRNGLPPSWVECQIMVLSSRTRGTVAHLKLTLKHGDERLLQYIFAIQKELKKELLVTDPTASRWLNGMSWQLEIDNSCTRPTLPDKAFWQPVIAAQEAKNQAPNQAPSQAPKSAPQTVAAASAPTPAAGQQATARPVQPAPRAATPAPTAPVTATARPAAPAAPASPANAPQPSSSINALRQLRESRGGGTLPPAAPATGKPPAPPTAVNPALAAAHAAVPSAQPRTASPAKEQRARPQLGLDYGAPNFECSRPAEETDLTPELARLFSLNDEQWRDEVKKQVSAVGYENTQPFRKPDSK